MAGAFPFPLPGADMGRRKISRWQSPSLAYERDAAPILKQARKHAEKVERRDEYSARRRALVAPTAERTGLRVIKSLLAYPSPAALDRLARFCRDPQQPGMVRVEAARAILRLAIGEEPRPHENDE